MNNGIPQPLRFKAHQVFRALLAWVVLAVACASLQVARAAQADSVEVRIRPVGTEAVLEWQSSVRLPFASSFAEYFIHQSSDLQNWSVTGPIRGEAGVGNEMRRQAMGNPAAPTFYRVSARAQQGPAINDPAGMLGYGDIFSRELQALGQISVGEFVAGQPAAPAYLPEITFDPTTADYWAAFNLAPEAFNTSPTPRYTDFRLNPTELEVFRRNGFVVSPRLGGYSFADVFYKIYTDDLPVFISTDAILQAWHRTFAAMQSEIEETYLAPRLLTLIRAMQRKVPELAAQAAGTPLEIGVRNADLHLAVAESLLTGVTYYGSLGQNIEINSMLARVQALAPATIRIFGSDRLVDFSHFTIRGHYDLSPRLSRYFRAVMWLGLIDLRIVDPPREFAAIAALNQLLDLASARQDWVHLNSVLTHIAGAPDGMDFSQIDPIFRSVGLAPPFTQLQAAYDQILAGAVGVQEIMGGPFESPFSPEQVKLPRTFSILPRRFTIDSWALGKTVFDRIYWDDDEIPSPYDKVQRRIPSALDVVYAVLGNNQVVPEIAARISAANGMPWRDGLPYQHNLEAARRTLDRQNPAAWTQSVYSLWLNSLRALSAPTTDPIYPDAMRTRAWAMKTVNTQLASWTQLRHDTVLYAKQTYTPEMGCSYPKGFVEPRLEFWDALAQVVRKQRDLVATLPVAWPPDISPPIVFPPDPRPPGEVLQAQRIAMLDGFLFNLARLREISRKELNDIEFTPEEQRFLDGSMEQRSGYGLGERSYSGWYPNLFYRNIRQAFPYGTNQGSDLWDAVVTEVHTAIPDENHNYPGATLHQATGNAHLAMIAVNCRDGSKNIFAGPVMSHYEFQRGPTTRLTDNEWKAEIRNAGLPPAPEWTQSYLVPGPYTVPPLADRPN